MSIFKVPNSEKQIIQGNRGDYDGNVFATFNIDLDSQKGTIRTAPKIVPVLTEDELGDTVIQALTLHDGDYFVVTTDEVFHCSTNDDPTDPDEWTDIATLALEDIGFESDATAYLGKLLISLGTDIMSWDGSKDDDWWTTTVAGSALTANYTHLLEVLRTGVDTLFVTDKNLIRYYNPTAGHTTITLDTLMVACALAPSLDRMCVNGGDRSGHAAAQNPASGGAPRGMARALVT